MREKRRGAEGEPVRIGCRGFEAGSTQKGPENSGLPARGGTSYRRTEPALGFSVQQTAVVLVEREDTRLAVLATRTSSDRLDAPAPVLHRCSSATLALSSLSSLPGLRAMLPRMSSSRLSIHSPGSVGVEPLQSPLFAPVSLAKFPVHASAVEFLWYYVEAEDC